MKLFILVLFSCMFVQESHPSSLFSRFSPFQKKERDEFIKYRNSPIYSKYFTKTITSSAEFKAVYAEYQEYLKNWNTRFVYSLNQQIPDLRATVDQPRLFGRVQDLFEYMVKSDIYDDVAVKMGIREFVGKCKVKYPAMAESEVKSGKDVQMNEYMFFSAPCSKEAFDLLTKSKSAIDNFFGFSSTFEKPQPQQEQLSNKEDDEWDVVSTQEAKQESVMVNRKKCIQSPTPDCIQYVQKVYFATKYRPLTAMLYGKGNTYPSVTLEPETATILEKCSKPQSFGDPQCPALARSLVQYIDEVSPNEVFDLTPNPQLYLAEHPEKIDELFDESDFKAQSTYQNYNGYKEIKDIFMHIYSAACALDITFRMRVSPTENASFAEKQLASSDTEMAKKARSMVSTVSGKLQSWKGSDSKVLSSIGKTGSDVVSTNASSNLIENEDIFINPEYIGFYVQKWSDISALPLKLEDGATTTLGDLIKTPNSIKKQDLKKNNITIEVDYETLFAILSKICISILGPDYLKAEENLAKAMEEEDSNAFSKKLKEIKSSLSDNASEKASRAFRFLPTTEYNKLRQIALVILTNVHTILLDNRFKKQGKQSPFHVVATQLKKALEEQLSFFARYLYALEQQKYDANSLSTSPFNYSFADIFLKPIYPVSENDLSSLIDADATNLYSIYSSYLLGSIHGVIGEQSTSEISFDNRSQKKKLLSDFRKQFGLEAGITLKNALSGGIKTVLSTVTPLPHFVTGAIGSVATAVLMAGPELIYNKLRQTCRFNKDKCIAKKLKSVDLSKPLDVIITDFLVSFGHTLQSQMGLEGNGKENERQFFPIMVTLFEMENEDMRQANLLQEPPIRELKSFLERLKKRTQDYYAHMGDTSDSSPDSNQQETTFGEGIQEGSQNNSLNDVIAEKSPTLSSQGDMFGESLSENSFVEEGHTSGNQPLNIPPQKTQIMTNQMQMQNQNFG